MNRVIVIGAGMGGMATAARLQRMGHAVTVIEASATYGGKCRSETLEGFTFDTGPTLLTIPAVYRDLFQRTGKHLGQVVTLEPVDPSFDYRFADGSSVRFANLSRKKTIEAIAQAFGQHAARSWDEALMRAEAMWDVSREPFIEKELRARSFLRPHFLKDLATIAPWRSLRNLNLSDPRLQMIMDRYATYSGSDPRKAPAVLSTIAFIEEAFGAWHIKGGIGKLAQALYERCCELGVEFQFNSSVTKVLTTGAHATGVRLSEGHELLAENVVANCDASYLYSTLIDSRAAKSERRKLAAAEPSFAGFSILLGLTKSEIELAHHTVLFPKDYDREFSDLFTHRRVCADPTIYICAPKDSSMSPDDKHESYSILVNAPRHGDVDWSNRALVESYAEKIIDTIEARGISVRDRIVVKAVRTPLDLQNATLAPGGSIYGTSSNGARSAFLRAKNRSPIKNLFLVGGSAHPGGGLPLVGLSAEMVAEAIGSRTGRPKGH